MPGEDPAALPDPPDDADEEIAEDADITSKATNDATYVASIQGTLSAIQAAQAAIAVDSFTSPALDAAWSACLGVGLGYSTLDPKSVEALSACENYANRVLAQQPLGGPDSDAVLQAKEYNLRRFLAGVLGIDAPTVQDNALPIFYELAKRIAYYPDGYDADIPGSQTLSPSVTTFVSSYTAKFGSEGAMGFWPQVETYIGDEITSGTPMSLADLSLFMQYTQQLFPAQSTDVSPWQSSADKWTYVMNIISTAQARMTEMKATALDASHVAYALWALGKGVPIAASASAGGLALGQIIGTMKGWPRKTN